MKQFIIKTNNFLSRDIKCYYNCDYVGYRKQGNPDFINRIKNMTKQYSEIDLVEDFVELCERLYRDIKLIAQVQGRKDLVICTIPRSKTDKSYAQSQLMFKKAVSCMADKLDLKNATEAIKRVKTTKTTHSWRLENNTGNMPYAGITKDTCQIDTTAIKGKNIILVDDIYTEGVNIAEDCIQTLLDLGSKDVILYVIAKTRG